MADESTQNQKEARVARYDSAIIGKSLRTDSGFLKASAVVGKVGVVKYRLADGSMQAELRSEEELFKADSLESMQMMPLTLGHPPEDAQRNRAVDSRNAPAYQVGTIGETIERQDEKIVANLIVNDQRAIDAIEAGTQQISPGYFARLDFTPGVFNGEKYDAIQREIRYNHVAIVDAGRAGPDVRLRLDGFSVDEKSSETVARADEVMPQSETPPQATIAIGDVSYSVPQMVADSYAALQSQLRRMQDTMQKVINTAHEMYSMNIDSAMKADAADSISREFAAGMSERVRVERIAADILPVDFKCDGKKLIDIKRAVAKKLTPELAQKIDHADAAYVDASFDLSVQKHEKTPLAQTPAPRVFEYAPPASPVPSARERFIEAQNARTQSLAQKSAQQKRFS